MEPPCPSTPSRSELAARRRGGRSDSGSREVARIRNYHVGGPVIDTPAKCGTSHYLRGETIGRPTSIVVEGGRYTGIRRTSGSGRDAALRILRAASEPHRRQAAKIGRHPPAVQAESAVGAGGGSRSDAIDNRAPGTGWRAIRSGLVRVGRFRRTTAWRRIESSIGPAVYRSASRRFALSAPRRASSRYGRAAASAWRHSRSTWL